MSFVTGSAVLIAAIALASAVAQAGTNPCPASLRTRQVASAPPGFAAVKAPAAAPFMTITFFDRDLGEAAALEPDEIRRFTDGTLVSTWTFSAGTWRPNNLRCAYFGTQVALVKELSPKITRCVATYDSAHKIGGLPVVRKIDCK